MPAGDRLLSAVLEPRRRTILRILADQPLAVGELAARFPVSRPAISQHLAVLRAAGLVEAATVDGRRAYRLRPEGVGAARAALEAVAAELPEEDGDGGAAGLVAVELDVAADPAAVFALLTEPAGVELWLGDDAVLDPRPGGIFRVVVGGDVARGEFVHVDPPHRVAFTWGREGDEGPLGPGATRVDVALAARPGGARVRVEHRGLPPSADAPHLAAWAHHLAQLGEVARQASAANAAS